MPLLFQCIDDSKHLLVIDLIVLFHQRQGFAIKGHWVLFLLSGQLLRKDGFGSEIRAVSLDAVKECKRELHTGTNKIMMYQLPIAC